MNHNLSNNSIEITGIPAERGLKLLWHDEFDQGALDPEKWAPQLGTGLEYGLDAWGNQELQSYAAENAFVEDGMLVLEARKDSSRGTEYTSGKVRTISDSKDLFSFKYGYVEARVKLPAGDGLWPAFWLMPTNSPYGEWARSGEMDVFEARGRLTNTFLGGASFGSEKPNQIVANRDYVFEPGQSITDFHIYAMEWRPDRFIWYIDNKEYFTLDKWSCRDAEWPAPFNTEFHLVLNLAVGGCFDDGRKPDAKDIPARLYCDYVRVYSL